jgi:hypothetical protein
MMTASTFSSLILLIMLLKCSDSVFKHTIATNDSIIKRLDLALKTFETLLNFEHGRHVVGTSKVCRCRLENLAEYVMERSGNGEVMMMMMVGNVHARPLLRAKRGKEPTTRVAAVKYCKLRWRYMIWTSEVRPQN